MSNEASSSNDQAPQTSRNAAPLSVLDAVNGSIPLVSLEIGQSIVGIPVREGPSVPLLDASAGVTRHVRTWILRGDVGYLTAVLMPVREDVLPAVAGTIARIARGPSGYRVELA